MPTALLTTVLTGLVFGLALHYSRSFFFWEGIVRIFIVMILAFLVSDLVSPLIIRGGRGIVQVPLSGSSRTRPRAYAFLVLFISIPIAGLFIDWLSQVIMGVLVESVPTIVSSQVQIETSGLIADLAVALTLAVLVYIDLQVKYYAR